MVVFEFNAETKQATWYSPKTGDKLLTLADMTFIVASEINVMVDKVYREGLKEGHQNLIDRINYLYDNDGRW